MGGGIDGLYAIAGNDSDDTTEFSGTNLTASIFDINNDSYLVQESGAIGYIANQSPSPDIPIVYWTDPDTVQNTDGYTPLTCRISCSADGACPMTCNGFNGTQNNYCDDFWYLGWPDGAPCSNAFNIYAVSL
ncbi:hypothetical protein CLAFUW4_02898 [Fulvia fulva]|uniref:Uncharacterized protein n=1 Tax=Passalora fulva TaxID=5499 RepID=A0A9Q8LBK4_PASFU|nr:uncharacterized protein CLAFUR5_02886 [Fulvia fulva]KAK4630956.1 hypothetical protein CLAFUR4_02891 [Fulvia fulva]KAK4633806.1 hypothetical protein CLAFUR0_02894 [Fulvia fulva]UJO14465.1 hypothetical protein CLAFUR5_02886 [Fulvia fulva]WPV11492.1 hypothetical protein CLAFUW4_02898 [Fulvia fulva]WPV26904.1 hypothetical protein CLAFUW7_02895 [Fulvia fulva]